MKISANPSLTKDDYSNEGPMDLLNVTKQVTAKTNAAAITMENAAKENNSLRENNIEQVATEVDAAATVVEDAI